MINQIVYFVLSQERSQMIQIDHKTQINSKVTAGMAWGSRLARKSKTTPRAIATRTIHLLLMITRKYTTINANLKLINAKN